jgi:DNA processing protein
VGTRRPSPYGMGTAERLGAELAGRGVVVVSGLARGIDTAAHPGALSAGRTLAVLGTGMDVVYPAENRKLADSIAEKGALVSEFPLGTPPLPGNFPLRNRLLAGLALGTVVVEARERSGSLITARLALESNREVFAVPGPIDSPRSTGPHTLIRQGACLVTRWQDVVEELPAAERHRLLARDEPKTSGSTERDASERGVLAALSPTEARSIDSLLSNVAASPSEIYSALLALELEGLVRRLSGDRYVLSVLGITSK